MIFRKFVESISRNLKVNHFKQKHYVHRQTTRCTQKGLIHQSKNVHTDFSPQLLISSSILVGFSFFKKSTEEETPEDKLIMTIKRSILSIQRKEYDKAERILHLALRMAQDLNHKDGITYIYDVLGNLAMERNQFQKAEKIFIEVIQRLFAKGETENDIKVLHINCKIAHMAHLQGNLDKAAQGFIWTLSKIEENVKKIPDSMELKELKAITSEWYGQMLMDKKKYREALQYFKQSYDLFVECFGEKYEELVPILNNLSIAALELNETEVAKQYIFQALALLKKVPEAMSESLLHANLGLLYLREGLLDKAKHACDYAYKLGRKLSELESVQQASYCLEEIRKSTK